MNDWIDMQDRMDLLELEMQRFLAEQCEKGVWVTQDGEYLVIRDMQYHHLLNASNMVQRMGEEGNRWIYRKRLATELRRRSRLAASAAKQLDD